MSPDPLLAFDAAHVWHPYAAMPASPAPYLVESASGVRLQLAGGTELIDGMSSWWAAIHGYRHPVLDAAARAQLDRMSHVMFGGLTHEPAIALAEKLIAVAPEGLSNVFFSDSGSVAVEVAVKMALQYWQARGRPARNRLLTVRGGYHGDTFMAMSVCDPVGGMHHLFIGALPEQVFAEMPPATAGDEGWQSQTAELFERHSDAIAAVIVEPVVQGAGGMRFYDPSYVAELRRLCDEHDVLLILDEIATGFGRTGTMFAAEHADVSPDIMCVGKALTGGYLSMAATLCTSAVADAISAGPGGAFMHGPTFMANPLAAAIAGANLDLLQNSDWKTDVKRAESALNEGLAPAADLPAVADVRVLGAIGVIELVDPVDVDRVTKRAMQDGVWLRPFRNLIYAMPPYVCTDDDLATISRSMVAAAGA
ncbi:MAG TPA: adenosylmethionine--8-amino-7-oxononanoate transaminase [Mycobacteriales bacterium]|nr:adenosylmethionine--8-amino-7-oxononanoate transaminase [Mycobacteriales bacterium]